MKCLCKFSAIFDYNHGKDFFYWNNIKVYSHKNTKNGSMTYLVHAKILNTRSEIMIDIDFVLTQPLLSQALGGSDFGAIL